MKKNVKVTLIVTALIAAMFLAMTAFSLAEDVKAEKEAASDGKITLFLAGDLMCQYKQQEYELKNGKFDFNREFDYVRDIVSDADIAVANLETNIAPSKTLGMKKHKKYDQPYLNAPEAFLDAIKNAGFDGLVNANNHNCDTGIEGLKETIDAQEAYGLKHTGTFKSKNDKRYMVLKDEGIKVGVVSYYYYMNNSRKDFTEEQKDTYLNRYTKEQMEKDVKKMKKAGVDFAVVYLHTGKEYANEPNDNQKRAAKEIANAGADFVAISHAHTVQPYTRVKTTSGKYVPVMYSFGNFVAHQTGRVSKMTAAVSVNLKKTTDGKVKITSQKWYPMTMVSPKVSRSHGYQLIPCTEETYKKIDKERGNFDHLIRHLKTTRKKIVKIVGEKYKVVI